MGNLSFMAVKIHVKVFWVVTLCGAMVGYQYFRGPWCLSLHPENGYSMDLWNVGILPQHYTASQPTGPQLEQF